MRWTVKSPSRFHESSDRHKHSDLARDGMLELTPEAFAQFGRVMDFHAQLMQGSSAFMSETTSFFRASLFDPGDAGSTDLLWVSYDRSAPPEEFESHLLTEQALIPISGTIVQHLFRNDVDNGTVKRFLVRPGQGIVMSAGSFHTTTSVDGEVMCLMVSRTSTTDDLSHSLQSACQAVETVFAPPPC